MRSRESSGSRATSGAVVESRLFDAPGKRASELERPVAGELSFGQRQRPAMGLQTGTNFVGSAVGWKPLSGVASPKLGTQNGDFAIRTSVMRDASAFILLHKMSREMGWGNMIPWIKLLHQAHAFSHQVDNVTIPENRMDVLPRASLCSCACFRITALGVPPDPRTMRRQP